MLKITHNAGFFSCCNSKFRKIVDYFNTNRTLPKIVDSSQQFSFYKPTFIEFNRDITYHFFLSPLRQNIIIPFKEPIKVTEDKSEDQYSDYKKLNITQIKPFIEKYFSPAPEIVYIKKMLLDKYQINPEECMAVYYRGTDKYQETTLGDHSIYSEKINAVIKSTSNAKVIVQTDSSDFLNYQLQNINLNKKNIIVIDENRTSNKNIGIHRENDGNANYREMKYLFATFLIMSQCKHIITSSGNCSLWMMYYRGNTNNIHQYLDSGFIGNMSPKIPPVS